MLQHDQQLFHGQFRLFYTHCHPSNHTQLTLGSVKYIYLNGNGHADARHNWQLFTQIVARSRCDLPAFMHTISRIVSENVADNRNQLAHSTPIQQTIAQALHDVIIGRKDKSGILCWLAEHVEPKR